jgi:hypothetical protein
MSATDRPSSDSSVLVVGVVLLLLLTPLVALSTVLPGAGLILALGLVASRHWVRDVQLRPLRVLVTAVAAVAVLLACYGLLT